MSATTIDWTPCCDVLVRNAFAKSPVLPAIALRRLRECLASLVATGCISDWSGCHPLWEDETQTRVRLKFPDDRSLTAFLICWKVPDHSR
jgi:hypothetical protein